MKVYSYTVGKVKNPSVAEEITQNTFFKAIVSKDDFKGKSNEFTWLCSIAKNLCYDYFREEGRKRDLPEKDIALGNNDYEEDYLLKETSFAIHMILHELEEPYKEVFELRVFGELSFSEISRIFGKSESWARVTYHRARLKIKERLDTHDQ